MDSGLWMGWPTLVYGWKRGYITRDQLISHAMDQIGYCAPEIEPLVTDLAYVDPHFGWTIDGLTTELETIDAVGVHDVPRIWRFVLWGSLIDLLGSCVSDARRGGIEVAGVEQFDEDMYCSLIEFCADNGIADEPPLSFPSEVNALDTFDYWDVVLQDQRMWLESERRQLLAIDGQN